MTKKDCLTCLYMATHEKCNDDGGCLNTPDDFAKYRNIGVMPPFRYRHWVEATPMAQMDRYHDMQLAGTRNIVLGPGEAEVNTQRTPQEVSKNLHSVAEQCGYMVERLTPDTGDGRQSLTIWKDFGPFRIEWENGKLVRIMQGEKDELHEFWTANPGTWAV